MALYPLQRKRSGELILPGRVRKTTTWPFMTDTTLPATLTTVGTGASGTVTCRNQSASTGDLVISSTNGTLVGVLTAAAVNLASFESVLFEAEGMWTEDGNAQSGGLQMNATSAGAAYGLTSGFVKTNPGSANSVLQNIDPLAANFINRRSLGMLILPRYGHVYMLLDGEIVSDIDYSGGSGSQGTLTLGAVQPEVYITAKTSLTTILHIEQLKLTTTSY